MSTISFPSCIDYHRTMAATLTAGDALNREASILALAKDFWFLTRDLRALVAEINNLTQAPSKELETFV